MGSLFQSWQETTTWTKNRLPVLKWLSVLQKSGTSLHAKEAKELSPNLFDSSSLMKFISFTMTVDLCLSRWSHARSGRLKQRKRWCDWLVWVQPCQIMKMLQPSCVLTLPRASFSLTTVLDQCHWNSSILALQKRNQWKDYRFVSQSRPWNELWWPSLEICPEMHSLRCIAISKSVSVPLPFL